MEPQSTWVVVPVQTQYASIDMGIQANRDQLSHYRGERDGSRSVGSPGQGKKELKIDGTYFHAVTKFSLLQHQKKHVSLHCV